MKSVFIIDDNQDMKSLIDLVLTSEGGYVLRFSPDGLDGINQLKNGLRPDLILLDYQMPLMLGTDFLLTLEKDLPEVFNSTPIVMITALNPSLVPLNKATAVIQKFSSMKEIKDVTKKYVR